MMTEEKLDQLLHGVRANKTEMEEKLAPRIALRRLATRNSSTSTLTFRTASCQ